MSPRTEETNQLIREEQRERILAAAGTVFARKGQAILWGRLTLLPYFSWC